MKAWQGKVIKLDSHGKRENIPFLPLFLGVPLLFLVVSSVSCLLSISSPDDINRNINKEAVLNQNMTFKTEIMPSHS